GIDRLVEDHVNARRLADGLAAIDPACVDAASVETNMVFLDLSPFQKRAEEVTDALRRQGVVTTGAGSRMRLVTHRDVTATGIDRALEAFTAVLTG
ncbi:MAG TPA: low-specificity L-threonine aldolase, partial [Actinomycetota bacterium]|nr:low-specificity L-threonine aldolase [Actinomycetota bacterium]